MRLIILIIFLLLVLCIGLGFLYNTLIKRRNQMREGWSGIEVQLKRRHDLIPNLVACVKGVANFEQDVLVKVTEARQRARQAKTAKETESAETKLVDDMGQFFALSESYPELQSTESFRALMFELSDVEDHLQYARRYYNGSVRDLNNSIESFPSNLIANAFGFQRGVFFEVAEVSERMAPNLKSLLK